MLVCLASHGCDPIAESAVGMSKGYKNEEAPEACALAGGAAIAGCHSGRMH